MASHSRMVLCNYTLQLNTLASKWRNNRFLVLVTWQTAIDAKFEFLRKSNMEQKRAHGARANTVRIGELNRVIILNIGLPIESRLNGRIDTHL